MATAAKKTRRQMLGDLERSQAQDIANAEVVKVRPGRYDAPISVRLSEPLLKRLDRIATKENRKRGNLIQHILWEYVRGR